jgi:hypothetical protein
MPERLTVWSPASSSIGTGLVMASSVGGRLLV